MILFCLIAVGPASRPADDAITQYLRGCGHVEGPVRFKTADGADKQAFACTSKGKTRVAVFGALPSGQLGRQCDSVPVVGTGNKLEHVRVNGVDMVRSRVVSPTPDDERVTDQALLVRWGACQVIAESNLLHPLDGPMLREPRAGLELDEDGIDAWQEIARVRFGADRRKVAVAMRGVRIEPQARGEVTEIEAEPYEPVALQSTSKKGSVILDGVAGAFTLGPNERNHILFERTLVRAVRVRINGALMWPFSLSIGGQTLEWREKQDWTSRAGVFGFGFLAQKGPTMARESVAFFDPPLDTGELEVSLGPGKGEPLSIESVRVLRDVKEWPLFEESEDFGERESE